MTCIARSWSRFLNLENPWFDDEQETWSTVRITDPWLLIQKGIVPGSTAIPAGEQPNQLERDFPEERLLQTSSSKPLTRGKRLTKRRTSVAYRSVRSPRASTGSAEGFLGMGK